MEDAHPFAVQFRDDNPHALERAGVYEQALALVSAVDAVVEKAEARFHLKDLLDKSATMTALRIAQAAGETARADRRKHYRIARRAATDCAAILDILGRRPGCDPALIGPARTIILALITQLAHLATR
ncbi:MAG: four helix bundle protein [Kofleriaceae bacterium]